MPAAKTLGTIDPIPPVIRDVPGPVRMFHEEHLGIETDAEAPRPGAIVEIVPSYAPAAVTLHEVYSPGRAGPRGRRLARPRPSRGP